MAADGRVTPAAAPGSPDLASLITDLASRAPGAAGRAPSLRALLDLRPSAEAHGFGPASVLFVSLVKEAATLYLKEKMLGSSFAGEPGRVRDYLDMALSGERVEKFAAVFVDGKGVVAASEVLHEGTINQTAVYPRKAVEAAFRHKAAAVLFAHNHPSGDSSPSATDRELFRTLDRAAAAAGIEVLDHVVIGRYGRFSLRESRAAGLAIAAEPGPRPRG